ncbi:MAG: hypothetical protein J6Y69_11640 [Treponema sp.]|nr:hypothetical protein [Treponema sp.]
MRKLIKPAIAAIIGTLLFTVSSAAQTVSATLSDQESTVSTTKEEKAAVQEEKTEQPKKDPSKLRTKANLKGNSEAKRRSKITNDPYTGWIYIPEKHYTLQIGDMMIELDGRTGGFCIYAIPETEGEIPLLSTQESLTSSYFVLQMDGRNYVLTKRNGIKTEARRTPYGGQMVYQVGNKAQLIVDFSFMPSIATSTRVDMLRVTLYAVNLTKTTKTMAVKGIFDTYLGEGNGTHFSTKTLGKINKEKQYNAFYDEQWVTSENANAAIRFILSSQRLGTPETVTLASKNRVSSELWKPSIDEAKGFNSASSYNNSGIGVNWKPATVDPYQVEAYTFYISCSTGGNDPAGESFIKELDAGTVALLPDHPTKLASSSEAPKPVELSDADIQTWYWENMPSVVDPESAYWNDASMSFTNVPSAAKEAGAKDFEQKNVSGTGNSGGNNVKYGDSDEIDMEYIQLLLDHIAEIENSDQVNDAELEFLNAEIDSVMEKLRGF